MTLSPDQKLGAEGRIRHTLHSPCSVAAQLYILECRCESELVGRLTDPFQLSGYLSKAHLAPISQTRPLASVTADKYVGVAAIVLQSACVKRQ